MCCYCIVHVSCGGIEFPWSIYCFVFAIISALRRAFGLRCLWAGTPSQACSTLVSRFPSDQPPLGYCNNNILFSQQMRGWASRKFPTGQKRFAHLRIHGPSSRRSSVVSLRDASPLSIVSSFDPTQLLRSDETTSKLRPMDDGSQQGSVAR